MIFKSYLYPTRNTWHCKLSFDKSRYQNLLLTQKTFATINQYILLCKLHHFWTRGIVNNIVDFRLRYVLSYLTKSQQIHADSCDIDSNLIHTVSVFRFLFGTFFNSTWHAHVYLAQLFFNKNFISKLTSNSFTSHIKRFLHLPFLKQFMLHIVSSKKPWCNKEKTDFN